MYGRLGLTSAQPSVKIDDILKYINTVALVKMPNGVDVKEQEINPDQIRRNFLNFFNDLSSELATWVSDIKAIEIITASGNITVKIEGEDSDITNLANGGNVSGEVKVPEVRYHWKTSGKSSKHFPFDWTGP